MEQCVVSLKHIGKRPSASLAHHHIPSDALRQGKPIAAAQPLCSGRLPQQEHGVERSGQAGHVYPSLSHPGQVGNRTGLCCRGMACQTVVNRGEFLNDLRVDRRQTVCSCARACRIARHGLQECVGGDGRGGRGDCRSPSSSLLRQDTARNQSLRVASSERSIRAPIWANVRPSQYRIRNSVR